MDKKFYFFPENNRKSVEVCKQGYDQTTFSLGKIALAIKGW
jgi:hypothetical protein